MKKLFLILSALMALSLFSCEPDIPDGKSIVFRPPPPVDEAKFVGKWKAMKGEGGEICAFELEIIPIAEQKYKYRIKTTQQDTEGPIKIIQRAQNFLHLYGLGKKDDEPLEILIVEPELIVYNGEDFDGTYVSCFSECDGREFSLVRADK